MRYCEVDWIEDAGSERMWCSVHDEEAKHCALNGDDRVCEKYAKAQGCNCCPENHDDQFVDIRVRKADFMNEWTSGFFNEWIRRYFDKLDGD